MKRFACLVAAALLFSSPGCNPKPKTDQSANKGTQSSVEKSPTTTDTKSNQSTIRFDDVTPSSGIKHTIASGYESHVFGMPEIAGGGVGVIDIDLDGRMDLAFAGGGHYPSSQSITGYPGAMYRATGDFQFQDISSKSGFNLSSNYNHSVLVDDVDADGFDDILVSGFGSVQLFMNQGDGTYARSDQALNLVDDSWSTATASGDFDSDGLLDLYVAHYGNWSFENNPPCISDTLPGNVRVTCSPTIFPGIDHRIFKMTESSLFEDASAASKLSKSGRGFGVLCADFDSDGDIDIYVANDEDANYYYINDGHGVFTESAMQTGCATDPNGESQGSMGIAIGDYQNDAHADILVTNFKNELNALYSARGSRGFRFATQQAGITKSDAAAIGWGTAFVDLDLNSFEDIIITNGHVDWQDPKFKQLPNIYANQDGKYHEVNSTAGDYFQNRWPGRGLAMFDANGDGLLDCVITHLDDPSHILKNASQPQGSYLTVRLVGTQSNRNAVGAIVELVDSAGKPLQQRHVYGGGSFFSTSQRILHFSTATADAKGPLKLVVQWPGGTRQPVEIDQWNQSIVIVEGTEKDKPLSWFRSE